jgi:ribosomal protein S18 acetylase RimI-like enzyme
MSTSDTDLYRRGARTLLASWEAYAAAAVDAAVRRLPGVTAAVFPHAPERGIYNNALLDRGLDRAQRARALDGMESVYEAAGVARFAAWVHDSDDATRAAVEARGYGFDSATRAMALTLRDVTLPAARINHAPLAWPDYLRMFELPDDLLGGSDHDGLRLLAARIEGVNVAAAMAFDHDGDCGIYNVGTLAAYRRRGFATALTALQLRDAAKRGCSTASVQATPMAERVYAALGFRDLGRYLEYVPRRSLTT